MNKSFIERIFPHSPGSRLPQHTYDTPTSPSRSSASPPHILLHDSVALTSQSRASSAASPRPRNQHLSPSVVRHDDPFLPVERASKSLERTLQTLLDAQSEGLAAGIGAGDLDDISSVGSPTPTPSVVTPKSRRDTGPKTIPIRQPKAKKISLHGARRGLGKSMKEFADLKRHELKLIEGEIVARDDALKQVSDLGNQKTLLDDKIQAIRQEETSVGLRTEVQRVDLEIQELENTLFELKARHRHLVSRLREEDSTKESRISSYNESARLNETQTRQFLRHPPIVQSLGPDFQSGMYALKADRRTLQMAQEQWTAEVEMLHLRRSDVENEKTALKEGAALWRDVVHRINTFEKELQAQTRDLSQSQLQSYAGDPSLAKLGLETSMQVILTKLSTLTTELETDLKTAELRNWNLLICSIGAEVAALEQARELLTGTSATANGDTRSPGGLHTTTDLIDGTATDDDRDQDAPNDDLLNDVATPTTESGATATRLRSSSPGAESNQSLEDTLREFGGGGRPLDSRNGQSEAPARTSSDGSSAPKGKDKGNTTAKGAEPMSESEDDDPGPDFFLSHS